MATGNNTLSWLKKPGVLAALPVSLFLIIGFAGPLAMVIGYSFMPPKTLPSASLRLTQSSGIAS